MSTLNKAWVWVCIVAYMAVNAACTLGWAEILYRKE